MFAARTLMLGTAAALFLGLSACATTRSALTGSTLDLQHSANTLAEDASNLPPPADEGYAVDVNYARDAHELAESARELRHTVQEGGSDADVRMAFNRVSRSFHAVRDEVHHSDSERARADLRPVEAAYDDVQHDLGEYSGYPAS
ncbi:MAG: hypothetical protein WA747_15685 [Steroidobacteraceae bacterium]